MPKALTEKQVRAILYESMKLAGQHAEHLANTAKKKAPDFAAFANMLRTLESEKTK